MPEIAQVTLSLADIVTTAVEFSATDTDAVEPVADPGPVITGAVESITTGVVAEIVTFAGVLLETTDVEVDVPDTYVAPPPPPDPPPEYPPPPPPPLHAPLPPPPNPPHAPLQVVPVLAPP